MRFVHRKSQYQADKLFCEKVANAVSEWIASKLYLEPDRDLEMEAASMGLSKKELSSFFRFKYSEHFLTFRTRLRVQEAQEMIRLHPDLPASVISEMCGFSDRRNFERYFKKIVGTTPAAWRRKFIK